jgi:hypothetical protein
MDFIYIFNSFKSTGSCSNPISYADVVKKVNVEEPTHGFPAASDFQLVKNMSSYGQHDLLYGFHIYFHDHLCCENKHDHA